MIISFEELKEKIPISEVVKDCGVRLNAKNFACCPFHHEKTPSFKVYDDRFQCFGCGASGDVFDFVQRFYSISLKDAITRLDKQYKLGLDAELSPEVIQQIREERIMHKTERALRAQRKAQAREVEDRMTAELRQLHGEMISEHTPEEKKLIQKRIDILDQILDDYMLDGQYEMVIYLGMKDKYKDGDFLSANGIQSKWKEKDD